MSEKVVFLDVGQGDAILLQDQTRQVLVDGGSGMAVLQELGKEMPWFDRTIEVVVSTHPDKDHLEGLLHVLERYRVELVLLPRVAHTSQLYEEWLKRVAAAAEGGDLGYRFAWQGQILKVGDIEISVLGPSEAALALASAGKTNNASVITRVDFGELSLLLTGDAEAAAERILVQEIASSQLDVDILKAGHHGSKTSTSVGLLAAAKPGVAVISVGADNSYGHPHPEVLARLADISTWRTDEQGSVHFLYTEGQWLLKTAK